jgi:hypothetical protein
MARREVELADALDSQTVQQRSLKKSLDVMHFQAQPQVAIQDKIAELRTACLAVSRPRSLAFEQPAVFSVH